MGLKKSLAYWVAQLAWRSRSGLSGFAGRQDGVGQWIGHN